MNPVRISDALLAVAFDPKRDLTEALDEFYAPDYTHRSDGKTLDRAEFAEMVTQVRGQIASGTVTVLDELRDGPRYAERHVYEITLTTGPPPSGRSRSSGRTPRTAGSATSVRSVSTFPPEPSRQQHRRAPCPDLTTPTRTSSRLTSATSCPRCRRTRWSRC